MNDVRDNDALGRLDPLAVVGDLREGAKGLENGVAGRLDTLRAFEDLLGHTADVKAAAREESEGVGVAIDGSGVS